MTPVLDVAHVSLRFGGITALNEHRALATAIASRDVERARAEMLKVLGDFPAEVKRTLENR